MPRKAPYEDWRQENGIAEHARAIRQYEPKPETVHHVDFDYSMFEIIRKAYSLSSERMRKSENAGNGVYWPVLGLEAWSGRDTCLDGCVGDAMRELKKRQPDELKEMLLMYIGQIRNPVEKRRTFDEFVQLTKKIEKNYHKL